MSTATDYRTRELAKRDRQAERKNGRSSKEQNIRAFSVSLGTKGTK